jgi:hypothetical protein
VRAGLVVCIGPAVAEMRCLIPSTGGLVPPTSVSLTIHGSLFAKLGRGVAVMCRRLPGRPVARIGGMFLRRARRPNRGGMLSIRRLLVEIAGDRVFTASRLVAIAGRLICVAGRLICVAGRLICVAGRRIPVAGQTLG